MTAQQEISQAPDRPATRVSPPALLALAILVGYGLQQLWVLGPQNWSGGSAAGWGVIGAGVAILVTSWVQFYRAQTNVLHHRPASQLIRSGLFRFSRNPIYVAALLLQLGIGLLNGNLWIVLLIPVTKLALERYVIAPEEAYLERAFGEVYADYRRSVRRWL